MNQNYKPENHLRPIELHHADISLEKDIQKILHNRKSGKKEKIKAPQGTARSILQCASEEPCPVLFGFSSTKSSKAPAGSFIYYSCCNVFHICCRKAKLCFIMAPDACTSVTSRYRGLYLVEIKNPSFCLVRQLVALREQICMSSLNVQLIFNIAVSKYKATASARCDTIYKLSFM